MVAVKYEKTTGFTKKNTCKQSSVLRAVKTWQIVFTVKATTNGKHIIFVLEQAAVDSGRVYSWPLMQGIIYEGGILGRGV
ncbi:MAG TPA: hypothetical protein GXZ36_06485 [Firmicutes bacterium]|jgi:hypothetical protein|nr:hypothetical protein [Bacillota bacterium]